MEQSTRRPRQSDTTPQTNVPAHVIRSFTIDCASDLVLLLALYPVLAFMAPTKGRTEFYPFFSWNLFASSSSRETDAVIIVLQINGRTLETPQLFFDLKDDFTAARTQNIQLAKLLDNQIKATWRGETDFPAALGDVVETTYMSDVADVVYDIAIIVYHPVERYRSGTLQEILVVSSHEKTPE